MFKHLENVNEKEMRKFAKRFCKDMNWPKLKISRFKLGRMSQFRGYALVNIINNVENRFILVSNNPVVYAVDTIENYDLMCALVHEMVHIYLWHTTKKVEWAFSHGKKFIKVCEEIQKKSRGFYTVKNLVN